MTHFAAALVLLNVRVTDALRLCAIVWSTYFVWHGAAGFLSTAVGSPQQRFSAKDTRQVPRHEELAAGVWLLCLTSVCELCPRILNIGVGEWLKKAAVARPQQKELSVRHASLVFAQPNFPYLYFIFFKLLKGAPPARVGLADIRSMAELYFILCERFELCDND